MKRSILVCTALSCGLALSAVAHGDAGSVKLATAKRGNGQPGAGALVNMHNGEIITLKNAKSGLCIGVENGHTNNGALLYQGACNGAPDQNWQIWAASSSINGGQHLQSGDLLYLENVKNGKRCMGVDQAKVTPGANIGLYDCHFSKGVSNQKWLVKPIWRGLSLTGFANIKNMKSSRAHPQSEGYCVGVDWAKSTRAQLKQFPCDHKTNQAWQVLPRS